MIKQVSPGGCRGVCVKRLTDCVGARRGERLVGGFGAWRKRRYNAFTLIELIVVVGIISVLAGLVLSTVGYARKKGALARAETEIAGIDTDDWRAPDMRPDDPLATRNCFCVHGDQQSVIKRYASS